MNSRFFISARFLSLSLVLTSSVSAFDENIQQQIPQKDRTQILTTSNLVAWCIVPFDAKKRSPAERAEMLKELGIRRSAYDWRAEHVGSFEQEIIEYQKRGIEYFAFWSQHEKAFQLFEKYKIHPQIWQTLHSPKGATQKEKVQNATASLKPLAERTKRMKCPLGLYNHGGWGGEPENLVAVCRELRRQGFQHVGIVYNFHHGHGHIQDWKESLKLMQPYLICLNLNGMNENAQPKILGLGKGRHEQKMIEVILESGYQGPIGILDHQSNRDTREALQENLDGLSELRRKLKEKQRKTSPQESSEKEASNDLSQSDRPYDPQFVTELIQEAETKGNSLRGLQVFTHAKSACLSCHRIGEMGGTVGPELTKIESKKNLEYLVESVFWPKREVKSEYVLWQVVTSEGKVHTGFREKFDPEKKNEPITLRDPGTGQKVTIPPDDIEFAKAGTTPMPAGLTLALSRQQQRDLVLFLKELKQKKGNIPADWKQVLHHAGSHKPASFVFNAAPLDPEAWPNAKLRVNRDRLYDFYTKQAEHFRSQSVVPMLLAEYPGLDGGSLGHWGNQNEQTWSDDRWNKTILGSVQCGVFHAKGITVPRAVCLQLAEGNKKLSLCFDPDRLQYAALWKDGFVKFSSVRHGFLHGLQMTGTMLSLPEEMIREQQELLKGKPIRYQGFYRVGKRVVFAYRIGEVDYLDAPMMKEGRFVRELAPAAEHSLKDALKNAPKQWTQQFKTPIKLGKQHPYAVDTITLPEKNPWNALFFMGGHAFLSDGSALLCTMQGDVWRVTGLGTETAVWNRFAAGLHHPLGMVITDEDEIFIQCRDQLLRLHDLNEDGEADFHECFSRAFQTSAAGHDFICGLQRDAEGNFYTASGNQGVVKISSDGKTADVIATGFRNPDGIGLYPDGTVTVPCSEGGWTPASMICAIRPTLKLQQKPKEPLISESTSSLGIPHYGFRGPKKGQPPKLPLVYLPRGVDNSSGGQVFVTSSHWGPLKGRMIHLSFGMGAHFLLLRDEVRGLLQGAVVPLKGDFLSGVHRGKFHPFDGQLYVSGMNGWGSYTEGDGCFQRVRYTGGKVQLPVGFHVHENGILIEFTEPIEREIAEDIKSHFAQCWNYRYSAAYGSPEFSPSHPGVQGHDPLTISSAHVMKNGRTLFLEIPDLQPVSQLHLRLHVNSSTTSGSIWNEEGHDLFLSPHRLDVPFTNFPGYRPVKKIIAAHPLLTDMALNTKRIANPYRKKIKTARPITIETGKNLTYATREFKVKAGEAIAFTLSNPDVVPHNWALVNPDALQNVGMMANRLISDPEAVVRHYIPKTDDVIAYTDVVPPGAKMTIYFRAPKKPGRYPYLCTFPGHWMVMNGVMIVE